MLTRTLPRFPQSLPICRQCLRFRTQASNNGSRRSISWSALRKNFQPRSIPFSRYRPNSLSIPKSFPSAFNVRSLWQKAATDGQNGSSHFPIISHKIVAYWLLGSAASVFGIVVFGGLTRLTESGLSITEWRPVTGSQPPTNAEDWEAEFSKYRSSPEFQRLNPHMTLDEFKSIYWMEWIHRQWGRFVGLSFVLPAVYFVAAKKVSAPMTLRLAGIAGLIGFQGFLGWWMVKSGLKDDLFAPGSHPRVSQYRLTAHLGAAFLCYAAMLWNGLDILRFNRFWDGKRLHAIIRRLNTPKLTFFRCSVGGLAALVFTTAMSGGLVAGLDAGLIYNEFPYMGNGLAPPTSELFDERYSRLPTQSDLWWRNMLENPSLVQLQHRILAVTTVSSVAALWAYTKFSKNMKKNLPRFAKRGVHGVVGFVFLQAGLGISTLLYLVPLPLASAHQAGSLALFTSVLVLGSRVFYSRGAISVMRRLATVTGKTRHFQPSPLHRSKPDPTPH